MTSEYLAKCLMKNNPVPLIAVGIAAPLLMYVTPAELPFFAITQLVSLAVALSVVAVASHRIAQTIKPFVAIVIALGSVATITTIAALIPHLEKLHAIEAVLPLVFFATIRAMHEGSYSVKRKVKPVLLDAFGLWGIAVTLAVAGTFVVAQLSINYAIYVLHSIPICAQGSTFVALFVTAVCVALVRLFFKQKAGKNP